MNLNPLLLVDFYKMTHGKMYPENCSKLVSYYVPRMSRLKDQKELIMFGLQGFIKEYLANEYYSTLFDKNFFKVGKSIVIHQYRCLVEKCLGKDVVDLKKIEALHDLGYLPLEIKALPEGTRVPVGVPMIEISNTHPDFAWLVNTIETMMSCSLWHTQMSANVGYMYRQIVNEWYDKSVDDSYPRARALSDFSMRGQESVESAVHSSAAFLLSFLNTVTVPAILYLDKNYVDPVNDEGTEIGYGSVSTEHSTVCSNYGVDGDEETFFKKLITEIYPKGNVSYVADAYDYWNFIDNILPKFKDVILAREGICSIRGDSGSLVEVVTKTVFKLWDIFGGTVNEKGYKVLDSHVRAIYSDSVMPNHLVEIYRILTNNGFACNNCLLGVGSFSFQCLREDDKIQPYTRDTFGLKISSTYCEVNGKEYQIYKQPKECDFKKSHKGLCYVHILENKIVCDDNHSSESLKNSIKLFGKNMLETIFKDGELVKEQSLTEIRNRLHEDKF